MGEGTADPVQVQACWVPHSCIRRHQVPVGAQHGLGLPVAWISLGLTVLTLLVLGQVALLVEGVAVGLLGLLVVVLGHGAQLNQLHSVRLLRGVLVGVPVIRRGLQVHLLLLLLLQVLHHGWGLIILRYLHRTLPLLLLLLLKLKLRRADLRLWLHFLHGHTLLPSLLLLLLWVILVLLHLLHVLGQHLWALQWLSSLHWHLSQWLLVVVIQVPLARVLPDLKSWFGQPTSETRVRLLGHLLVAGRDRWCWGLHGLLGQQLAKGTVRGSIHHC